MSREKNLRHWIGYFLDSLGISKTGRDLKEDLRVDAMS